MLQSMLLRLCPELERRLSELEKRPIFDLQAIDPSSNYIFLFPDSLSDAQFAAISLKLKDIPNVVVLSADKVKVIQIS